MRARISDWLRERRIQRYLQVGLKYLHAGKKTEARAAMTLAVAEVEARSAAQVARMERRQGLGL